MMHSVTWNGWPFDPWRMPVGLAEKCSHEFPTLLLAPDEGVTLDDREQRLLDKWNLHLEWYVLGPILGDFI